MSYGVCSICERGPTIRHDTSGLCQACKLSTGLSAQEAKERVVSYWRVTGIEPGMERNEALSRFIEFKDNPTCIRCGGKKLKNFCSANLICKEADEMEVMNNADRNDNRDRVIEVDEPETVRAKLSKARKRNALR